MQSLTIQQAFDLARQHQAQGRLTEAESLYRQILAAQPQHLDALQLLGVLEHQRGNNERAIELIRQAIALNPHVGSCYSNLGMVLATIGRLDEAIEQFRNAASISPDKPQILNNLGNALQAAGKMDEAIAVQKRAVELLPNYAMAHNNLGAALCAAGRFDEGVASIEAALAIDDRYAQAHFNLGKSYLERGNAQAAIAHFRRGAELDPRYVDCLNNLGAALQTVGLIDDAIAAYQQALSVMPNSADLWGNLGTALWEKQELDEAIGAYRRSISLRGDLPEPHGNLASALAQTGQTDEALAEHRLARECNPPARTASTFLVFTHLHPDLDAQAIWQEHVRWSDKYARHLYPPGKSWVSEGRRASSPRRLRIGYVSAYFNDRPVGRFLTPLLSNHDRSQFEIFCYSDVRSPDSTTDKLRGWTDAWRETVGVNDGQFAELVRSDAIDILVDLGMHTRGNRMLAFARKPAPIQVTYLAYCGTTGLQTIDYRLSDPHLDPDDRDQTCCSEKTTRLKSYWCYPPPADAPPVNSPPFATAGTITFGCLNDFSKVNPRVLSLWARILRTLPNSRLLLHCPPGNHRQPISSLFQSSGVDPNRIELMPMLIMPDYFRLYHHIDIALDPTPWPGGTTTCDSLWMGVPVVTTTAKTAVSRGGASILSQLSLTDFVASDADQYVELATTLAADTGRLSTLRSTLRDRMQSSPLMNAPGFTKDIEAAFRDMWETWRRSA